MQYRRIKNHIHECIQVNTNGFRGIKAKVLEMNMVNDIICIT